MDSGSCRQGVLSQPPVQLRRHLHRPQYQLRRCAWPADLLARTTTNGKAAALGLLWFRVFPINSVTYSNIKQLLHKVYIVRVPQRCFLAPRRWRIPQRMLRVIWIYSSGDKPGFSSGLTLVASSLRIPTPEDPGILSSVHKLLRYTPGCCAYLLSCKGVAIPRFCLNLINVKLFEF